jgi:hypothetical protein
MEVQNRRRNRSATSATVRWERLWWVRLRGRARVLDGGEEAERALSLLAQKYEQYRETAPGFPVLAVDVDEWRGWSASA